MTQSEFEKIRIGDIVIANKSSNRAYSCSNEENNFGGTIKQIDAQGSFEIRGTQGNFKDHCFWVDFQFFDLVRHISKSNLNCL